MEFNLMSEKLKKMDTLDTIKKGTKTDKKKKAMINALTKTLGIVSPAADQAGISTSIHYEWLKKDEKYREQVNEILEKQIDFVEGALMKLVKDQNPASVIFYLKTKGKKRGYTEKEVETETKNINITISKTKDIEKIIDNLENIDDDE